MRYLALLRGINVGTSGRIRMDALKQLLEEAGFSDVSTYIQSGNVFLNSPLAEDAVRKTIERALLDGAAIATTTIVRTAEEVDDAILHCPFPAEEIAAAQAENAESESLYLCLLPRKPDEASLEKLRAAAAGADAFAVLNRTIYLLLRQSIRTSKLAIRLQKIFPEMTVRNWNTMTKLRELLQAANGEPR